VEHLGIIATGLGLGGLGTFGALFHTLNHSVCKTLTFCAAGRIGHAYGTYDMRKITGALASDRVWGGGMLLGIFALIGMVPFSVFMSELLILKAAIDAGRLWIAVLFLIGAGIVFIGASQHAISMAWGKLPDGVRARAPRLADAGIVASLLLILVLLGLSMPRPVQEILSQAAAVIGGAP
jgi:hydrogenase-4 component F